MRQTVTAALMVIASIGLLLAGCRSDLPARFSRLSEPMPERAGGDPAYSPPSYPYVDFAADFNWCEGMTATLKVNEPGVFYDKPYSISADMGGGTTENLPEGTAMTVPFEHTFTLAKPGTYSYSVTLVDTKGRSFPTSRSYEIGDEYRPLKLTAWYERPWGRLIIEVGQYDGANTLVMVEDLPEWAVIPEGAVHQIAGGSAEMEFALDFLPHEENSCTILVSADDTAGHSQTESVEIIRPLFVYAAYYNPVAGEIRLGVSAAFGDVVVELVPPEGVTVEGEFSQTKDDGGEYVFAVTWDEETFEGGDALLLASDQFGNTATGTVPLYTVPDVFEADALYAFPLRSAASIGQPVRIVVATGVPASPFAYMNGVGVTFDGGQPALVEGSFNVGSPGGDIKEPDGIWAAVNPLGFLLPPDFMIVGGIPGTRDDHLGSVAFGFNVTPLGDVETTGASGELFNFEVEFARPGIITLGFLEFSKVKRTYYMDGSGHEHDWGDISNQHPGALNTVYVE